MTDTKKPAAKTIVDVAHPGKSAPSSTSKPVLISNRTVLKDPMVVDTSTEAAQEVASEDKQPTSKASIKVTLQSQETPEAKPGETPSADKELEEDADEESQSDEPNVDDDNRAEKELELEAEKQAKHDELIDKLVIGKQYFLPIDASEKRKTKRFVVLGVVLSIVLALVWVDVALDANLIQISSVKPITHFFSN